MDHLIWDDLRFVRAVAEAGSVRKAAARLRVSHQTVARHITKVEASLEAKLFLRSSAGYLLTPAAEELVRTAQAVDEMIGDAARRLTAQDLRPAGTVRIAMIDWLVGELCPDLADLMQTFPDLTLEIAGSTEIASFSKREADVALRMERKPAADLVGKRILTSNAAIYASTDYLKRVPKRRALEQHLWIGLDEPWASLRPGAWLRKHVPRERVVARSSTPGAMVGLLRAGAGVGLLPCFCGDREPSLQRIRAGTIDELAVPLWLLTHADLKRTARVRAVMDFLEQRLSGYRGVFEGRVT